MTLKSQLVQEFIFAAGMIGCFSRDIIQGSNGSPEMMRASDAPRYRNGFIATLTVTTFDWFFGVGISYRLFLVD